MSIRVLIVEESAVVRELLRQIISADPRLEVAGAVETAEEALELLERLSPDVISLNIRLPGMQGFEATRCIMSRRPTPIVVVSASSESEELNLTMEALKAGALSVVEKPVAATHQEYAALARRLCTQLAIMSQVKVVRQRVAGSPFARPPRRPPAPAQGPYRILALAASTGGPTALMELLAGLGRGFPLPVVVVQHMTPSFTPGFGAWLGRVTSLPVEVVANPSPLAPGKIYLAPAGHHLLVEDGWAFCSGSEPIGNHRPSGSVLFSSVARVFRDAGIGVLLTGMGDDGAQGLFELRRAGGYTIAEHESTAVVYGMPAAGVKIGAVCESLPLPSIAPRIVELVQGRRRSASAI